jgi:phage terminase large subunit
MSTTYDAQVSIIESWAKDPLKFVTEALRVKRLSTQQKQAFEELRKLVWAKIKLAEGAKLTSEEKHYSKKIGISIMSGMGTGKDAFTSMAIIWFLCCFPKALIPCTAPTAHQLKDVLWREINKWRVGDHNDPPVVKDWIVWQSDKVYWEPEKGREWFAIGRTANPRGSAEEQAETLQGFHEDYMMMVADEAAAVPDAVFRPLEGTLTGKCNFMLLIFNPFHQTGFAIDTQTKYRDQWVCLHWDAEESENVSRESIEQKREKYGEDSNFYRVTVKGLPPISSSDTLIPYEWAMDAINADLEPLPDDPEVFGLDIGAGGDPSIILPMQGPKVLPVMQMETSDSEVLTGWVMGKVFEHEPKLVFGDVIGVGWALMGNLKTRVPIELSKIIPVNVSNVASNENRFTKLRDELAWRVREKFEQRTISIPNDPILIGEATTIKFEEPNGKIKVESKKELKARGLKSPNRFDALCLAHYFNSTFIKRSAGGDPLWKKRQQPSGSWKTV